MMGWGNQGYGMWGLGGMIVMIFFWVILIIGTILIILTAGHRGAAAPGGETISRERDPLEILKERYAKGEIDTQEFEERKKILESGG